MNEEYHIEAEKEIVDARTALRMMNSNQPVKVTEAGNVVDLVQLANEPPEIQTLCKGYNAEGVLEYIDMRTGEIITAKRSESRGDKMSQQQLRKTYRRMREIVNANWYGDSNELFLTLTYAENMQDTKRLRKDLEKFVKKMKRALGDIKYLTAVEPQARGAWHAHVLVKQLNAHKTYWPAEEVAEKWGHGFVSVKSLRGVDNIGAYLTAYLSNAPADSAEDTQKLVDGMQEAGEDVPKAIRKGARLSWYPPGTHIFRASQNCTVPEAKKIRPHSADLKSVTANAAPRYAQITKLYAVDDAGNRRLINTITQIQLNRNSRWIRGTSSND